MTVPTRPEGKLYVPTVHLNGTSKRELIDLRAAAHSAVIAAMEKLVEAAPNARDFYVQGDEARQGAWSQHEARMTNLRAVRESLATELVAIDEQGG